MLVPEKYGGLGLSLIDFALVMEEIGWGDAGVASTIGVTSQAALSLANVATEGQKEKWLRALCEDESGEFLIAGCNTESAGGSEVYCPLPDPNLGIKTRAIRDGEFWVINGLKLWTTSGGVAKLYIVHARTDLEGPNATSCTPFLVPAGTPGLKFGRCENKLGRRCQRNQEIFLEDVRVPHENILGGRLGGSYKWAWEPTPAGGRVVAHFYMGASTIGLARAAYEEALNYASEHKTWGKWTAPFRLDR